MTALDKRIKSAFSCSLFYERLGEKTKDWIYFDAASSFLDAEVAMLAYPRKLYLAIGDKDELFCYKHSIQEFARIKAVYHDYEKWIKLIVFSGGHELCKEDSIYLEFLEGLNVTGY